MPKVTIYDTRIFINRGELPHSSRREGNPHWENFKDLMRFLGSIGFYVGEDKEIKKKYPSLNETHRVGGFDDLRFKAQYANNRFEIEFYQDIVHVASHSFFYYLDKYEKMSYLIQKRYDWTKEKLLKYFEKCGYSIEFQTNTCKGDAFIIRDYIRSRHHPQENWFSLKAVDGQTAEHEMNGTDRDGKILRNGETKYFRDRSGYLLRGKVYHNINNMWWVLLADGQVRNVACFDLFDLKETDFRGRWKEHRPPQEYVERKKQLALCSVKELERELKRRDKNGCGEIFGRKKKDVSFLRRRFLWRMPALQ